MASLFFGWIWALVKKLWGIGFAIIAIIVVLVFIQISLEEAGNFEIAFLVSLLPIGVFIYLGLNGNKWRCNNLMNRGYEHIQTLKARTTDEAIALVAKSSLSETKVN